MSFECHTPGMHFWIHHNEDLEVEVVVFVVEVVVMVVEVDLDVCYYLMWNH